MTRSATIAVGIVTVLLALAGCGDDGSGGGGADPTLNEPVAIAVDDADPGATESPHGDAVLEEFEPLQRAAEAETVPAIRGSAGLSVPEWARTVDIDVANYWQRQFNRTGYEYDVPKEVIYDRPVRTGGCGMARNAYGPFYCTEDGAIYLPVRFFSRYSERFGDAAVAVIVAHENGHAVQDQIGNFDAGLLTVQTELQADCLAGVWARTVLKRGLLEQGDMGEILGLVEDSGDSIGTPIRSPGAHGSSGLRQRYFDAGYAGGRPADCPVPRRSEIRE